MHVSPVQAPSLTLVSVRRLPVLVVFVCGRVHECVADRGARVWWAGISPVPHNAPAQLHWTPDHALDSQGWVCTFHVQHKPTMACMAAATAQAGGQDQAHREFTLLAMGGQV